MKTRLGFILSHEAFRKINLDYQVEVPIHSHKNNATLNFILLNLFILFKDKKIIKVCSLE